MNGRIQTAFALAIFGAPAALPAEELTARTVRDFECYVKAAEGRMDARKAFLFAESDGALNEQLVRGRKVQTIPGNGANPHDVTGGQIYDWVGSVFIPGATLDRTIRMLQDYDHRAQYFSEVLSASKLICHTGTEHFRFTMRLKEPAVIDTENDVVWERVGPRRWRCRSYSTSVREIGRQHGYLQRLYSYWRFAETDMGVYAEGQTITLSGKFGSMTRALGSALLGINPEKSLKRSLSSMRETALKPDLEFAPSPAASPGCGEPFKPDGCASTLTTAR
jgi:hypothetical protein